ncbi:MAG: type 2 isopentenyl-diphosphate Delta-isomerase [Lactobacillales bacterium]|jgi:isopentenyl-diphosphate delta-isomerase|nr:type 2 isopentenyl-diphosphate Delta-isomerase [Lactobacillales bacterium]
MNRKDEHVSLTKAFHGKHQNSFDDVRFVHHSLPNMDVREADISTKVAGFSFKQPFFINAMTGGSGKTGEINRKLGEVAKETGLLIATGSVSSAIRDSSLASSFTSIRESNPDGIIFANIGAGNTVEHAKKAVELFQANGLQIHLNAPQELIMPEGDREFSNWKENIAQIVQTLKVPVVVKEVGFGMSRETMKELEALGVKIIDVSGAGGTNFAQIENARRKKRELDFLENWGQSTVLSLLEAEEFRTTGTVLASGGIRTALDVVKALALGATSVGVSATFLTYLLDNGVDTTIDFIHQWEKEIQLIFTMLGAKTIEELQRTALLFSGDTRNWAVDRGIPIKKISQR